MNKPLIAAKLLTLLASGATIERTIADLPMFKPQIELALGWMKTIGRCSSGEIVARATRLREVNQQKNQAIRHQDFDLAANMRAEECALFESFRLEPPTGAIMNVAIDKQIADLAALFQDTNAA
ncbi:MAG TPA: UvrB/UvrC motif-containing protein [Candidatus Sulfotelmatobacter sp.]|nr:UvrB/UvrC motif-containing protein [Candidatus Sulfotelmatobacter sp.]